MPQVLNNRWAQSLLVAVLFVATGELGHRLAIPPGLATPVWLPSGISVAAFICLGTHVWPGVFAGAAIVSSLPLLRSPHPSGTLFALSIGVLIAVAVTSEPFLAERLYRRTRRGGSLLEHPGNVSALLLKAGPISCAFAASLACITLVASGALEWSRVGETWLTWLTGDLAGIYLLAPAILTWHDGDNVRLSDQDRAGVPIAIVGLAIVCVVSFLDQALIGRNLRLAFLPFPFVVFIAYRFNDRIASLVGAAVAAVAIVATARGYGPFTDQPTNHALIELQLFTLVGILTALFTRAVNNELATAERERRRLSADLAHLSRVTLMGELAAGMAHEYHQPLTAISNYANAALRMLSKHEGVPREIHDPLQRIADESVRAAGIVDRLKGFLQKRHTQRAFCDPNEIATESLRLIQMAHSFPGVSFTSRLTPSLPHTYVDSVQITQILVNLLLNSCEAIENSDMPKGEVRVRTQPDGSRGIRIYVEDTGPGMSSEAVQACFDQFFSTKDRGLGIGLGISRTLAQAHGGDLTLESSNGGGTCFCLHLPLRDEAAS